METIVLCVLNWKDMNNNVNIAIRRRKWNLYIGPHCTISKTSHVAKYYVNSDVWQRKCQVMGSVHIVMGNIHCKNHKDWKQIEGIYISADGRNESHQITTSKQLKKR